MLTHLRIENFILIEQLALSFSSGLTVLTGETGAGKSILLDAVEGVLGGKLSSSVIRVGATKALLEGTFITGATVQGWLVQQELEPTEELVISREITPKSSRYRLNGLVVSQNLIQQLRELLIDVTAQGQALGLSRSEVQRELLDRFAQAEVERTQVQQCYQLWQTTKQRLEQALQQQQTTQSQRELLRQQHQELKAARITHPKEEDELIAEQEVLLHTVELKENTQKSYQLLHRGSPSASEQLATVSRLLEQMAHIDPQLLPLGEMVQSALVQIEECARQVHHYSETLESDPERLTVIEQRLKELQKICLKYGPTLQDVLDFQQHIQQQWQQLKTNNPPLEALKTQVETTHHQLLQACQNLTQLRTTAALRLEQEITQSLTPLGMAKARFLVQLATIPPTAEGQERIEFLLTANPGQPPAPLKSVASGGEMARFLLSLKVSLGQQIPTLIFDEIDVGVSGKVAQAVALRLQQLARQHQVLCVTHQPLVAAMADTHWRVRKVTLETQTHIYVDTLDALTERTAELAQLAGGNSAEQAQTFAAALLAEARQLRETD